MSCRAILKFTAVVAAMALVACGGGGDDDNGSEFDLLHVRATVTEADGVTPVAGLNITRYDWVIDFTDGSTISVPVTQAFTTDAAGKFSFDSGNLSLASGNLAASCTDVCVDYEETFVDYECYDWQTYYGDAYCADWEIDEYGDDYCADWEYDSYDVCVDWEPVYDEYCAEWGQDCDYYYPARDITDIKQAYSTITYNVGTQATQVVSPGYNTPAASASKQSVPNTKDTQEIWTQTDTFSLPAVEAMAKVKVASAKPNNNTEKRQAITRAYNQSHARPSMKVTHVGAGARAARKGHPAAKYTAFSQLDSVKQARVQQARQACGASLRSGVNPAAAK